MREDPKNVQYYSSLEKELKRSQVHKAKKFLEHSCIEYDKEEKGFVCKPIEGYNKTTYILKRNKEVEGGFACNCQHFVMKEKRGEDPRCSHILALHYWFDQRNKAKGWGRHKQETLNLG